MNKNSVYRCDAVYGVFLYQSFFVKENEKSLDGLGADSIVDLYDDSKEPF